MAARRINDHQPKTRTLAVFAHLNGQFEPAGLLDMTEQGADLSASSFRYGLRYLERPNAVEIDPVSLALTDRNAVRGQVLAPAGGLPYFGGLRDAAPDAWGRRLIEARLKAPANSLPESTYLLNTGSQRVGALDVRPTLHSPFQEAPHSLHRLEYLLEASERIEQGLPVPAQLDDIFDAGSSVGGMRPKVTVEDDNGDLWLAKFPSVGDTLDIPCLEAATLRLAAQAGLDVPNVYTLRLRGKTVMLIRRFDRLRIEEKQHRRHVVSALTLLGCAEADSPRKSYGEIADGLRRHAAPQLIATARAELFGRMVFNIFVTNDDDHLRNHALLWNTEAGGWGLSPLYDVMPRPTLASERFLHLGVGAQGRLATLDNALSGCSRFGLTLQRAEEIVDRIWRVTREWKTWFESFGTPGEEIEKISPAFRHVDNLRQ